MPWSMQKKPLTLEKKKHKKHSSPSKKSKPQKKKHKKYYGAFKSTHYDPWIKKTENSSKNSLQDHRLRIDGKTPWKWQRSKSESLVHSFQDHSDDLHGENTDKCPDEDSFKTIHQKSGKSVLSRPSTKYAKNGPKSGSFKTIKSQNVHKKGSFKTIEDGSKNNFFQDHGWKRPKINFFQDHCK